MHSSSYDPEPKDRGIRWRNHLPGATIICKVCEVHFTVRPSRAKTAKYCCYKCHQIGEGKKGGVTRGLQMKLKSNGKAYIKTKGRHAHRIIAEQLLKRPLKKGEVVHHKDGNKLNNDPNNIEILLNQSCHAKIHFKNGRFVKS